MSETESPSTPADSTGPRFHFPNLKAEFAQELVSDLAGLGEAFDRGEVDQAGFLNFCLAHLRKIDNYIGS